MTSIFSAVASLLPRTFFAFWLVTVSGATVALAEDVWMPFVYIASIKQETDHTLRIETDPAISGNAFCTGGSGPEMVIPATNGTNPSYLSIAPFVVGAFLYYKMASFHFVGCSTDTNSPIVTGIMLQQ